MDETDENQLIDVVDEQNFNLSPVTNQMLPNFSETLTSEQQSFVMRNVAGFSSDNQNSENTHQDSSSSDGSTRSFEQKATGDPENDVLRAENCKDTIYTKRENADEKDVITSYGQTSHQIMDKSNRNHDAPLKPARVPMKQLNTNTPIIMNARTQSSNVKPEPTNSVDKLIRAIVNPQAPLPEIFISEEMVKNIVPSTTQYLNQPTSKPPKLNIVKRPIFPELNSAKNSWNPPTSPQNSILNSTQHSIHQTVHDSIHNASQINDQIGAQYNAKINGQNQASSSNSAQNQQPQNYFPQKLYRILMKGQYPSIQWNDDGKSFKIDQQEFEQKFLKKSVCENNPENPVSEEDGFQTNKYASFVRQLNLYGFKKIMANRDNINNVELVNGIGMVDACGQSIHEAQSYYQENFYRGGEVDLHKVTRKANVRKREKEYKKGVSEAPEFSIPINWSKTSKRNNNVGLSQNSKIPKYDKFDNPTKCNYSELFQKIKSNVTSQPKSATKPEITKSFQAGGGRVVNLDNQDDKMDLFIACQLLLSKIPGKLEMTEQANMFAMNLTDEYESLKIASYLHSQPKIRDLVSDKMGKLKELETCQQNNEKLLLKLMMDSLKYMKGGDSKQVSAQNSSAQNGQGSAQNGQGLAQNGQGSAQNGQVSAPGQVSAHGQISAQGQVSTANGQTSAPNFLDMNNFRNPNVAPKTSKSQSFNHLNTIFENQALINPPTNSSNINPSIIPFQSMTAGHTLNQDLLRQNFNQIQPKATNLPSFQNAACTIQSEYQQFQSSRPIQVQNEIIPVQNNFSRTDLNQTGLIQPKQDQYQRQLPITNNSAATPNTFSFSLPIYQPDTNNNNNAIARKMSQHLQNNINKPPNGSNLPNPTFNLDLARILSEKLPVQHNK